MSTSSFSARDFIQLPTLEAHALESFLRRLLAQYRLHHAPLHHTKVAARAADLETALHPLTAALAASQAREHASREAIALDPLVVATWGALVGFLEAFARLDWRDEGKTAKAILESVFPTRMEFTQRKYPDKWSEANAHIAQIHARNADHPHEPTIAQKVHRLHGDVFLDEIADKHARYGKALGLTEGKRVSAAVDVHGPYEAAVHAAKDYVAAALQLDDDDVHDSERVKRDLLSVIDEFATTRATKDSGETGSGPAAGGSSTGSTG